MDRHSLANTRHLKNTTGWLLTDEGLSEMVGHGKELENQSTKVQNSETIETGGRANGSDCCKGVCEQAPK